MEKFSINGIVQALILTAVTGVVGEAWKMYMAVHDLQSKVEWLYHYDFPEAAKK